MNIVAKQLDPEIVYTLDNQLSRLIINLAFYWEKKNSLHMR